MEQISQARPVRRGVLMAFAHSHIGVALGAPENRVAAVVTLAVAGAVLLASQRPLAPGFTMDLRAAEPLGRGVTLVGFSAPRPGGRSVDAATAAVITNRPLPTSFELEVEGRAFGRALPAPYELRVGATRYRGSFDAPQSVQTVHVDNPHGEREIQIQPLAPEKNERAGAEVSGSGSVIVLTRLGVR